MTEQDILERHFVEEVGLVFDELGHPRMMGRITGFLLICEPPHQTAGAIAEYLNASRGAVSTIIRQLLGSGMVRRVPVQSSRATYLRLADDAFPELMRERMARLRILRDVGAQGLKLLDGSTPERRRRLQRFHDFYSFMEREFKPIIDRWDAEHPREDT